MMIKKPSQKIFELVLDAIVATSAATKKNDFGIQPSKIPTLRAISLDKIRSALDKLKNGKILEYTESQEEVLTLAEQAMVRTRLDVPDDDREGFYIKLRAGFDDWYSVYSLKKEVNLKEFDIETAKLKRVYLTVLDINTRYQFNHRVEMKLDLHTGWRDKLSRRTALTYLHEIKVVASWRFFSKKSYFSVRIDKNRFHAFMDMIKAYWGELYLHEKPPQISAWDSITMKVEDAHTIKFKPDGGQWKSFDYKDLKLGKKGKIPTKPSWDFLVNLINNNGKAELDDGDEEKSRTKKEKQAVVCALKEYFGIEEDPFPLSRTNNLYSARFQTAAIFTKLRRKDKVLPAPRQ